MRASDTPGFIVNHAGRAFGTEAFALLREGVAAIAQIDANPAAYTNRGTVNAGRICGIVGTVLLVLGVIWAIFVFVVAAGSNN